MIIENQAAVTDAVVEAFSRTEDPRLREILLGLVRHLHGFVREVRLTEREFQEATRIIAAIGQKTTASHNEVVLMAGSLGVSALVCLLNNGNNGQTETAANLLGPFWRMNSPPTENGGSIVRSPTPGPALFVNARVRDGAGLPVAVASLDETAEQAMRDRIDAVHSATGLLADGASRDRWLDTLAVLARGDDPPRPPREGMARGDDPAGPSREGMARCPPLISGRLTRLLLDAGRISTGEAGLRDVDLVIRTSGEKRLSDFLLWESAYAELHFTERMWPDFEAEDLAAALASFSRRERRFGGLRPLPSEQALSV